MNRFLIMGFFALIVVGISLWRLLAEKDLQYISRIKLVWGRTLGLGLHFVTNVGLPLVVGVVFVSKGIATFDPHVSVRSFVPALPQVRSLIADFSATRIAVVSSSLRDEFLQNFELLMP